MTFANPTCAARQLADLPNISFVLAEQLGRIGITTPDELRAADARALWRSLHQQGFHPSIQTLLALEGALHACRWSDLAPATRLALIRFAAEHEA